MVDQALSDVRILDLAYDIAGPFCTKLFADYGAEVIKIENPAGGDPARRMGPFSNDIAHPEKSGMFLHLNMNKKSITLDLSTLSGQSIFKKLVKRYRHCGGELPTRHPGLLGAIVQRVSPF